MPCGAQKVVASSIHTIRCLWITDDILAQAFNRFLRLSHTHRRHGSTAPGPLEARRRLAKRRHGITTVSNSGAPSGLDFGALFGSKLVDGPQQGYEKRVRWEAPAFGGLPPPGRLLKDNGDWRPWMVPETPARPEEWSKDDIFAKFWELPEDIVELSKVRFEHLLESAEVDKIVQEDDIRPMLDFLQSSKNESDVQLTLRLIQWLRDRRMSKQSLRALATIISQKMSLRTISEEEETAVLLGLIKRKDANTIVPSILDLVSDVTIKATIERLTAAVAASSTSKGQQRLHTWLSCLVASQSTAQAPHSKSEVWAIVYKQLLLQYRIADLAQHFRSLDERDFAMILLRYWVPQVRASTALPHDITWRSRPIGRTNKRAVYDHQPMQNNPLVDLIHTLAVHDVAYEPLLSDLLAYWQLVLEPETIVRIIYQMRSNVPRISIPTEAATSLIQAFIRKDQILPARHLFDLVGTASIGEFQDLPLKYIEIKRKPHGQHVWRMIDRWTEEDEFSVIQKRQTSIPNPEIVKLVHDAAYAWSKSPHIRARVAYRRVWECYRFLLDLQAPISRLLSRALVRAGIVNFIKERRPIAKTTVQYILAIVKRIEGREIMEKVDKMIFEHWRAHWHEARNLPRKRQQQQKWLGLQVVPNETQVFRSWNPRVAPFKGTSLWKRERGLFHAGEAVEAGRIERHEREADVMLGQGVVDGSHAESMAGVGESFKATAKAENESVVWLESQEVIQETHTYLTATQVGHERPGRLAGDEAPVNAERIGLKAVPLPLSSAANETDSGTSMSFMPFSFATPKPAEIMPPSSSRAAEPVHTGTPYGLRRKPEPRKRALAPAAIAKASYYLPFSDAVEEAATSNLSSSTKPPLLEDISQRMEQMVSSFPTRTEDTDRAARKRRETTFRRRADASPNSWSKSEGFRDRTAWQDFAVLWRGRRRQAKAAARSNVLHKHVIVGESVGQIFGPQSQGELSWEAPDEKVVLETSQSQLEGELPWEAHDAANEEVFHPQLGGELPWEAHDAAAEHVAQKLQNWVDPEYSWNPVMADMKRLVRRREKAPLIKGLRRVRPRYR